MGSASRRRALNPSSVRGAKPYAFSAFSFYACQVAKETLAASGLDPAFITSGRLGVAFGSTHGSPSVQRNIYKTFFSESKQQFASIGAVDYLKSMVHTTAVNITKMFGYGKENDQN